MKIDAQGIKKLYIDSMLIDFDKAKKWLEQKKLRIERTRFCKYRKIADDYFLKLKGVKYKEKEILWAFAELHDLLEIYNYLNLVEESKVEESLRKIVTGPVLLSDEKKDGGSIQGRNFTFELYAAARFLRAGLNVFFKSEADLNIDIHGTLLHVECKRAVSESNLENLINRAIDQIENRCRGNHYDRGIVVISISKILFKEQEKNAIGYRYEHKYLSSHLHASSLRFGDDLSSRFRSVSSKNLGIVFHYKFPFFNIENGYPYFINRFSWVPFSEKGSSNREIADYFSKSLKETIYN